jgi:hypothetical protein
MSMIRDASRPVLTRGWEALARPTAPPFRQQPLMMSSQRVKRVRWRPIPEAAQQSVRAQVSAQA